MEFKVWGFAKRSPLWFSGQSSWLQIQWSGFDSWRYQIFWEVMGLELGPLSLVSTTEELHGRNSSGSSPLNREYGRGDPLCWPRNTLSAKKKLALTSCGCSVGIVHSRTQATEFVSFVFSLQRFKLWHSRSFCFVFVRSRILSLFTDLALLLSLTSIFSKKFLLSFHSNCYHMTFSDGLASKWCYFSYFQTIFCRVWWTRLIMGSHPT
jgi:hypothetical protein